MIFTTIASIFLSLSAFVIICPQAQDQDPTSLGGDWYYSFYPDGGPNKYNPEQQCASVTIPVVTNKRLSITFKIQDPQLGYKYQYSFVGWSFSPDTDKNNLRWLQNKEGNIRTETLLKVVPGKYAVFLETNTYRGDTVEYFTLIILSKAKVLTKDELAEIEQVLKANSVDIKVTQGQNTDSMCSGH